MEKTTFSFAIDREQKEALEQAAKSLGLTFTELLRTGASFYASLDPVLRSKIRGFRERMGGDVSEQTILENIALSWLARFEVEEEAKIPILLTEFQFGDRGFLKGEKLYNAMKAEYKDLLDGEEVSGLILRAKYKKLSNEEELFLAEYFDSHKKQTTDSLKTKKKTPKQ